MGSIKVPSYGWKSPQTRDQFAEGDENPIETEVLLIEPLFQVIFNRDNILSLFEKFNVPKKFDLLSEDSDAYDFFLTEAILEARKRLMVDW